MRILLRSTRTGLYIAGNGEWTELPEEARDYRHTALALNAAVELRLSEVEVLLSFDDPDYDISLPVTPGPPRTSVAAPVPPSDPSRRPSA